MQVILINPKGALNEDDYELPSNIAYLASAAEKLDFIKKLEVLDLDLEYISISDSPDYLVTYVGKLDLSDLTVIALPVYTYNRIESEKICSIIKRTFPNIKIIVGGPHITLDGINWATKNENIDYAIRGEADLSFPDLLTQIYNNKPAKYVPGIIYRNNNGIYADNAPKRIEKLDMLNSQIDGFKYLAIDKIRSRIGYCSYITSRGCAFACSFCASSRIWNHKIIYPSSDIVKKDLFRIKQMGFDIVSFRDDFFTMNKKWTYEILPVLKDLNLKWGCETRIDSLDEKFLYDMKQANCVNLRVGIETFNEHGLKILNKKLNPKLAIKNLELALKIGIDEIRPSFIVGIPGETKYDVLKTVSICRKLKGIYPRFRALTPYVETDIYKNMDKYGIKYTDKPHLLGYSNIETRELTNTDINELLDQIYREFINPKVSSYHNDFSLILKGKIWKTKIK